VQAGYRARPTAAASVEVTAFIDDMAAAMQRAGLIVSRAGAVTIAEIAAAGRPAVLIPLAGAAGHQRANAELLAGAGAAVVVAPEKADAGRLAHIVGELLVDEPRRRRMGEAARRLAHSDAARSIADAIEKLGRAA
jgi:UDP-N-acetylglucosamine--N-acetylmuramyl-(pentapeptide) pyrophosphoryl-undecaprenol N-acetylglucosamine transferase